MLPFRYDPLDLSKRGIRLLRLLRSHVGPICCQLFEVQVTEQGCDTPYEALSYVWGSSDLTHQIGVNGKELSITANLHVALSYLRLADTDRVLWVDAVCIDQNNHKERGHQVQQMGDIYRQAQQVVVWLGEATFETDAFMTVLKKLQADMESEESPYRNWVPKYDNPSQQHWYERWIEDVRVIMCSKQPRRRDYPFGTFSEDCPFGTFSGYEMYCAKRGFDDILDRTWFRRVWILQEVANALAVVVCCGNLSVPGLYFAAAEDIIHAWYGGARFAPSFADSPQAVLEIMPTRRLALGSWWKHEGGRTMFSLLKHFGQGEATDQRDIVYALRGMSTDNGNPNLPIVSYEISEKLVAETTACFIFNRAVTSWTRLDSTSDLVEQLDWLLAACIAVDLECPRCDNLSHLPNRDIMETLREHPHMSEHWPLEDNIRATSTADGIRAYQRKLAGLYRNCEFHVPESTRDRSMTSDVEVLYAALQNAHMGAHIIDKFWENVISRNYVEFCATEVLRLVWGNNNERANSDLEGRGSSLPALPECIAAESLAALVSQMIRSCLVLEPFDHDWKSQEGETLLGYAMKTGNIWLAQKLLALDADPKLWSMGCTPLMLAAMHPHDGMEEITMTLLESGTDLHKSIRGETAMTLAKKHGNTEMVRLLNERRDFDPHKEPHMEPRKF